MFSKWTKVIDLITVGLKTNERFSQILSKLARKNRMLYNIFHTKFKKMLNHLLCVADMGDIFPVSVSTIKFVKKEVSLENSKEKMG